MRHSCGNASTESFKKRFLGSPDVIKDVITKSLRKRHNIRVLVRRKNSWREREPVADSIDDFNIYPHAASIGQNEQRVVSRMRDIEIKGFAQTGPFLTREPRPAIFVSLKS